MLGHVVSLTIHARMGYRRFTPSGRFSRKEAARHGGVHVPQLGSSVLLEEYIRGYSTRLYSVKSTQIIIQTLYYEMHMLSMNSLCSPASYENDDLGCARSSQICMIYTNVNQAVDYLVNTVTVGFPTRLLIAQVLGRTH